MIDLLPNRREPKSWTHGHAASVDFAAVDATARALTVELGSRIMGRLLGDFRGLGAGQGLDPRDLREYQIGDDVRHIDWNATARTGSAQTRTFEAERELETTFLIDISGSAHLGGGLCDKRSVAIGTAGVIGLALAGGVNRVGVAAFDGASTHLFASGTGRTHVRELLHTVDRLAPADTQTFGLGSALETLARRRGQRQLIVVASDFLDAGFVDGLRSLAVQHHVLAVEILDELDLTLPNVGRVAFLDPETGKTHRVNTGSRAVRSAFAEATAAQRRSVAADIASTGAGHIQLRTSDDWLSALAHRLVAGKLTAEASGGRP